MKFPCRITSETNQYLKSQDDLFDAAEILRAEAEWEWNALAPTEWIAEFQAYHADPDIDAAVEDFRRNWMQEWMENR